MKKEERKVVRLAPVATQAADAKAQAAEKRRQDRKKK